jgi:hypothetical protein
MVIPSAANRDLAPLMLEGPHPTTGGTAAAHRKGDETSAAMDEPKPENIRKLRLAYDQHEALARYTAKRILATLNSSGAKLTPDGAEFAHQKPELRLRVAEAFEARQRLQHAELDWLRQRLDRIEEQIARREPIKEQIIDRRVDELLNPYLQWDPSKLQVAAGEIRKGVKPKETSGESAADKEQRSRNNLKQLALAMHNYHDVSFDGYNSFPTAVVMGSARSTRNGKTPRSWRVDLLPFLEGNNDLYQQYRMDEAWDSPHNKKLIERMPDVFRSPYDDPKSTKCGYYVLVGPGTVFEKRPLGVRMSEIVDGTSNTILLVEAKRNIPWTKPEDIPFDPEKPVPELGGFVEGKFAAAMADGSVHVFDRAEVDGILKWMILRNDGHPIQVP